VLAPDGGFGLPTARLSVSPGAVDNAGDLVTLDARLSSDPYDGGTAGLQYSFDVLGTATTDAGVLPWTSWSPTPPPPGTGYGTGTVWHPRVAVRQGGNSNAIAYASATVASINGLLCVVDTASTNEDGASDCGTPYRPGTDGVISLPEAINLLNTSVALEYDDDKWRFVLGGNNLTDELYPVAGTSSLTTASGYAEIIYARPRSVTFSVTRNF
jgi:hypothetical protein